MQLDRAIRAPFGDDAKARFQQAHKRLDVVRAEAAADAQPAGRGIAHDELLRIAQIKFGDDLRERQRRELQPHALPSQRPRNLLRTHSGHDRWSLRRRRVHHRPLTGNERRRRAFQLLRGPHAWDDGALDLHFALGHQNFDFTRRAPHAKCRAHGAHGDTFRLDDEWPPDFSPP